MVVTLFLDGLWKVLLFSQHLAVASKKCQKITWCLFTHKHVPGDETVNRKAGSQGRGRNETSGSTSLNNIYVNGDHHPKIWWKKTVWNHQPDHWSYIYTVYIYIYIYIIYTIHTRFRWFNHNVYWFEHIRNLSATYQDTKGLAPGEMSCFMHFPSPPALQESRVTLWLIHSHHAEMEDALRLQWNHHGSPTISWRWNHVKTMVTIWLFDLPLPQQWQFGWFLGLPLYPWAWMAICENPLLPIKHLQRKWPVCLPHVYDYTVYARHHSSSSTVHQHPSSSIIIQHHPSSHIVKCRHTRKHIYIYNIVTIIYIYYTY